MEGKKTHIIEMKVFDVVNKIEKNIKNILLEFDEKKAEKLLSELKKQFVDLPIKDDEMCENIKNICKDDEIKIKYPNDILLIQALREKVGINPDIIEKVFSSFKKKKPVNNNLQQLYYSTYCPVI